MDEDITELVRHIASIVNDNAETCKVSIFCKIYLSTFLKLNFWMHVLVVFLPQKLLQRFVDYAFLWDNDIVQVFDQFLKGRESSPLQTSNPKPAWNSNTTINPSTIRRVASARTHSR